MYKIRGAVLWAQSISLASLAMPSARHAVTNIPWRPMAVGLGLVGSLAAPLCHIQAVQRLFRFVYTHNLSLAMDPNDAEERLSRDPSLQQWRYRLAWREPKRIRVTWEEWKRRFWYWFFFAGSVQDQLQQETQRHRRNEARRSGETIWERLAKEKKQNVDEPRPDRTVWKEQAMKRLADKHERDYEKKTFAVCISVVAYVTRPPSF